MNTVFRFLLATAFVCSVSIILFPLSKNDYYSQWQSIIDNKKWQQGEQIYTRAVKEYPDEISFHIFLNSCLRNQGDHERSLEQIAPLYQKYSDNVDVTNHYIWTIMALAWQIHTTDFDRAAQLFTEAYAIKPDDQWIINGYGYALREKGELQSSIEVLNRGWILYPENEYIPGNLIQAYINYANQYIEQGDLDEAGVLFAKAAEVNSEYEWYILHYSNYLRKIDEYEQSIKLINGGIKLYPENQYFSDNRKWAYYEYGRYLAAHEEYKKAINILKDGLSIYPDEIWMSANIADHYKQLGQYKKAAGYIQIMAQNRKRLGITSLNGHDIETSIYHNVNSICNRLAEAGQHTWVIRYIKQIKPLMDKIFLLVQLEGVFTYHAGDKEAGLDLSYEAYDIYIKQHPEHAHIVTVQLPLKGYYLIGGNSRRDAITHAGMNQFCYDFWGCDEKGLLSKTGVAYGSGRNEDYYGFGNPVYAPVDGVVDSIEDDKDDLPPSKTYGLLEGNYISITDESGYHHVLVHNKKHSARVTVGQSVKAGDIVAELGNSGMTTVPHLHYGVYSTDWLVSIPVQFEGYTIIGINGAADDQVANSIPQDGQIIRFP